MKKKFLYTASLGLLVCFLVSGTFYLKSELEYVSVWGTKYKLNNLAIDLLDYLKNNISVFNNKDLDKFVSFNINLDSIYSRSFVKKIEDLFTEKDYKLTYNIIYDKDSISKYIDEYNKTAEMPQNAYIIKGDSEFSIVKETSGNFINKSELLDYLDTVPSSVSIEDFYKTADIVSTDLESDLQELNNLSTWFCKYENGSEIRSCIDYVTYENGDISIDVSWIPKAIKDELKSYNTIGMERKFKTNSGDEILVSGGTWGSSINVEEETIFLTKCLYDNISIDGRTPEFSRNYESIGDTYIEVSLTDQHIWVFKDNTIIMDSACVTGDVSKKNNTPVGIYFISECINGKYLRGDGYKTWVNKWMRLTNSGIGLHDAYWRDSFGGGIYKYNGSHGCVNLPKKFAYDLYDIAYRGMPVIIY